MNLYIVEIDVNITKVMPYTIIGSTLPCDVNEIHKQIMNARKHQIGTSNWHTDSTLTVDDINDILISNGTIYWESTTIQYMAIDIDKTFDNTYENNIAADVKAILRDNKLKEIV